MEKVYQRPCKKIGYDSIHSRQHQSQLQAPFPYWTASLRFPSPYAWADFTWPPILPGCNAGGQPGIHGCRTNRSTASLPTIPIQAISVRLYAVWTRDVAIIGRASSVRDEQSSMDKSTCFSFLFLSSLLFYSLFLFHSSPDLTGEDTLKPKRGMISVYHAPLLRPDASPRPSFYLLF